MPQYQTVRTADGGIYADVGSAQLRKIPSLEEYQSGVASGLYSGTPRQLPATAGPAAGAGGMNYIGGYEVGGAGTGNFGTNSRSIASTPSGGTGIGTGGGTGMAGQITEGTGGAAAFQKGISNIIQSGSAAGSPSRTDQITTLRQKAADIDQQAFERQTEYTPSYLRNLTPGQQAELRRQRVTALSAEKGNYMAAIQTLQDEEEAAKDDEEKARETALETMNTYLKYGVFDQLSDAEKQTLASTAGMSLDAVQKIAEQAAAGEPPELREVGGSLYAVQWNPETGAYETNVVVAKPVSSGGSGGSGGTSSFRSRTDKIRSEIASGKISWAQGWNLIRGEFPSATSGEIDTALAGRATQLEDGSWTNEGLANPENIKGTDVGDALLNILTSGS